MKRSGYFEVQGILTAKEESLSNGKRQLLDVMRSKKSSKRQLVAASCFDDRLFPSAAFFHRVMDSSDHVKVACVFDDMLYLPF